MQEFKNFPGEKPPDPQRPRLTRQGRGASNAGKGRREGRRKGEKGREGYRGKGEGEGW